MSQTNPERRAPVRGSLRQFAAIGAAVAALAALFAWAAGWLSPHRLTQARMIDAFEQVSGSHPGFRHNHAKGLCVTGWFDSDGQAQALSAAGVFKPGRVEVVGRFALAGGMPFQPDAPATVRSLALRFLPKSGEEWRTGMNNIPVFPVKTARGFYEQLLASVPDPATGRPDPVKMQAFLAAHPETVKALALIKQRAISSGFADTTFNGLNAFRFVNAAGVAVPVRWAAVAVQPFAPFDPAAATSGGTNYLFDALIEQIRQHPLQWRLVVTVGEPGDPTGDATLPWPAGRTQIDAGTITLDTASSEEEGRCTAVNYDPLVLPAGIEPSDDPLLSARSSAYARSYTLRAGEHKPPSAVTPVEARAGGGRS
jgi:catalase